MPSVSREDQRAKLVDAARRVLEESGPEALQARKLTAEIGASTQAIYTLVGGMPGLFDALVRDGFVAFADYVRAVPLTDDPVADFFAQGTAYAEWAFAHPQLYRLMFGLTGGTLRSHFGLELRMSGALANFEEGRAASQVMVSAIERIKAAGRIGDVDPVVAAGQFLSATHGFVLLEMGGAFGEEGDLLRVARPLAVNLMVGLGDDRTRAERAFEQALQSRAAALGSGGAS
jgi:AcrR family transcriptional regulator